MPAVAKAACQPLRAHDDVSLDGMGVHVIANDREQRSEGERADVDPHVENVVTRVFVRAVGRYRLPSIVEMFGLNAPLPTITRPRPA